MRTSILLTFMAAAPLGCAPETTPDITPRIGGFDCEACGLNTAFIAGIPFNELALDGSPNAADTRLVSVHTSLGKAVELVVEGDQLFGRGEGGTELLTAGARLTVDIAGTPYVLEIAAVGEVEHWVASDGPKATTYHFQHVITDLDRRDLCPDLEPDPNIGLEGLPPNHFFAFTGDRYDFSTGEVMTGAATKRWVTFACDGSAPAKLHFTRHTEAGSYKEYQTTEKDRQAFMFLYRADYCGNGEAHTVTGHPLRYLDHDGWFEHFYGFGDDVQDFEALWDSDGAICLDHPRLGDPILCDGLPLPACDADPTALVWGDALFASGNP